MCTREEVRAELEANNRKRDKNLQNRLDNLKEELVVHIQKTIKDIPLHKTAPKTAEELNNIRNRHELQALKLTTMEEHLAGIVEILKENKQSDKENKEENKREHEKITQEGKLQHQETMEKLDEMSKTKADQVHITRLETIVNTKAEKTSLDRLEKLVSKVLWISTTSLLGVLSSVIWFLVEALLDK